MRSTQMIFMVLLLLNLPLVTLAATTPSNLLRLFTTADQRADLNRQRQKKLIVEKRKQIEATQKQIDPPPPPPGPQPPPYITFNGLVKRERGPSTVWVNESNNLFQKGFIVKPELRADLAVSIVLSPNSRNSKQILLEPGQTLDTRNGDIKDIFEQPPKPEVDKPKR